VKNKISSILSNFKLEIDAVQPFEVLVVPQNKAIIEEQYTILQRSLTEANS
jgi:hypothetical protein